MTFMQTDSGAIVDFSGFTRGIKQPIRIHDIAHGLAHTNRYAGHTIRPYTVAEHSVLVYQLACELYPHHLLIQGACLFHDAHEAYTGDPINPLKTYSPTLKAVYKDLHHAIDRQIEDVLRWPNGTLHNDCVKYCDSSVYAYESPRVRKIESEAVVAERIRHFDGGCMAWPDDRIEFLSPRVARWRFLTAAGDILGKIRDAGLCTRAPESVE